MSIKKLARCNLRDSETAAWGIVRDPNLALDYADEALAQARPDSPRLWRAA